jgi:hypothetical protein
MKLRPVYYSLPLALTFLSGSAGATPIAFVAGGPCSGTATKNIGVVTTAHCITYGLDLSIPQQFSVLRQMGARWITNNPLVCTAQNGEKFLDGAIALPQSIFFPPYFPPIPKGQRAQNVTYWQLLPNGWLAVFGGRPLSNMPLSSVSTAPLTSLNGLTQMSLQTGYKANLGEPRTYYQGWDPYIQGDSGSGAVDANNVLRAVFAASNNRYSYFYPLNGSNLVKLDMSTGRLGSGFPKDCVPLRK